MNIKVSKYVLTLCEYGISFTGLWYVSFYYKDDFDEVHYDAHHDFTLDGICEWCGCSKDDIENNLVRYDYKKKTLV